MSRVIASLLVAAALVVGCGEKSYDASVSSAKDFLAKNDAKSALIELKNALAQQPDAAEARLLMGRALLDRDEPALAVVELRKALDLHQPDSAVVPLLAKALALQGDHEQLVRSYATVTFDDPAATAMLKTSVADAYAALGNRANAEAALQAAFKAVPDHVPALILQARLKAGQGDRDTAASLAAKALLLAPANTEAWRLKGDLALTDKATLPQAVEAYRKILTLDKTNIVAHAALIQALMMQGDRTGATAQLDALKAAAPKHPTTQLIDAEFAYQRGDLKQARDTVQQLLKMAPRNVALLQLAGAVELAMGSALQAEKYLTQVVQLAPERVSARRLLATAYAGSGDAQKAVDLLTPLIVRGEADAETLATAGAAELQLGHADKAMALFNQAVKLNPHHARARAAIAMARLGKGDDAAVLAEMQSIAASSPDTSTDLLVIALSEERGDTATALQAIDALQRKQPKGALPSYLAGRIQLLRKDVPAARASFERALAAEPTYVSAAAALALLDLAERKPDAAKARFEAILKIQPSNLAARMAMAEMRAKAGAPVEEVAGMLAEAARTNPTDATPRVALVSLRLRARQTKAALATAQEGAAALPDNPRMLEALGSAQAAAGEYNQAFGSFGRLAEMQPNSPRGYLLLSKAYLQARKEPEAAASLRRALLVMPNLLEAQQSLIKIEQRAGRVQEALNIARTVQQQRPTEVIGFVLEGDLEAARRNMTAAMAAYRAGLKASEPTLAAEKLYVALRDVNRVAEAEQFASGWMRDRPKDALFKLHLADMAFSRRDFTMAETLYRDVVRLQPTAGSAMNNLAWLLNRNGRPEALDFANRALAVQPNRPEYLDTLTMVLLKQKQVTKAIETQKKAVALQPRNAWLRVNLARAYLAGGNKTQARTELNRVAALGDKFSGQSEVQQLMELL